MGSTARLGVDPFVYLRHVLDQVSVLSAARLDELLPDRFASSPFPSTG